MLARVQFVRGLADAVDRALQVQAAHLLKGLPSPLASVLGGLKGRWMEEEEEKGEGRGAACADDAATAAIPEASASTGSSLRSVTWSMVREDCTSLRMLSATAGTGGGRLSGRDAGVELLALARMPPAAVSSLLLSHDRSDSLSFAQVCMCVFVCVCVCMSLAPCPGAQGRFPRYPAVGLDGVGFRV